jgi:hypothetical protein
VTVCFYCGAPAITTSEFDEAVCEEHRDEPGNEDEFLTDFERRYSERLDRDKDDR